MGRDRELADDLIHTNSEYQKLKSANRDAERTPRETPAQQGPGRRGYDKAMLEQWTHEELLKHVQTLKIDVDESADRDRLIALIEESNAARAR